MPIDRMLWRWSLSKHHVPAWPCPSCESTLLAIADNSFQTINDRKTKFIEPRNYHPMMETGRFVCLLRCKQCEETCAVSGNYNTGNDVEIDEDNIPHEIYVEEGRPKSIFPPLPMIAVPPKCPLTIKNELSAAFSAYWSDYSSALNHIRQAIDLLLNDVGIPRSTVTKQKKRLPLSLHSRIDKLKSKKPNLADLCERLLAVKHLGNAGSHPGGEVAVDDIFDGFDILEWVLHDTYSEADSGLAKMVKQINRRKGPRKAKKKRP